MKAMILAAGRGERLRPLTRTTPKPLLRVGDTTLIDHALMQVRKAGITDVVINVHHLGDQIIQHCGDGAAYGLHIQYSIEDELLDTGGGIYRALPLLGSDPFLLLSADIWTDFPLYSLTQQSVEAAHLILVDNPAYHSTGDFGLNEDGIVRRNTSQQFTYGNMGVFHPALFQYESAGVFPLREVLFPAIEKGIVTGERYAGQWYNVGTPADLDQANTFISHC